MKIRYDSQNRIFIADAAYEDKDSLKAAGFWFHWEVGKCRFQGCKACAAGLIKKWWTFKPEVAAKFISCCDDAAREALDPTVKSLEGSRAADVQIDIPCPEGESYLGFQRAGIAYAATHEGTLIADEMGLGKTIQALGLINLKGFSRVLVICPATLRLNWAREAAKWLVSPTTILVGSSKPSLDILDCLVRTGALDNQVWKNCFEKVKNVNGSVEPPQKLGLSALYSSVSSGALSVGFQPTEGTKLIDQFLSGTRNTNLNAVAKRTDPTLPVYNSSNVRPMPNCSRNIKDRRESASSSQGSAPDSSIMVAQGTRSDTEALSRALDGQPPADFHKDAFKSGVTNSSGPCHMVLILNYDVVKNWYDILMQCTFDVLYLDECHKCKNPKAQRTKQVLGYYSRHNKVQVPGLVSRAKNKVMLTGTPILNRPIEIQPLAAALAPKQFGNFFTFAKRYCAAVQTKYGWDFTGASNLGELQERLRANIMVRRLKKDVLKELPPKTRSIILLNQNGMAGAVAEEHDTAGDLEAELDAAHAGAELALAAGDEDAYNAAVRKLDDKLQIAFSEMSAARHAMAVKKIPAVLEHCDEVLENVSKLVIFAHHHDVIAALAEHYGAQAVVLTGETSNEERQVAVDRFQNDPEVKVFIGSIQAAGVGITLTACSHVVFAELDWVPGNVTQAEDRCHRIGQQDNVTIQHLVVDGSLDARLAHILVWKQHIIEQALDTQREVKAPATGNADVRTLPMPPPRFPVASEAQRKACAAALQTLACRCDGARELDGAGFNKCDTNIGRALAYKSTLHPLTDGEVHLCKRMLPKYHAQVGEALIAAVKGK